MQTLNCDILHGLKADQKTVILHGCNCFNTMGAGIAKYLRGKFPNVYAVDCATKRGDKNKLGTCSRAVISHNLHILNCYTQYNYGREKKLYANYIAIDECFKRIAADYDTTWEIRMPRIGCGLAGGDWEVIGALVVNNFNKHNTNIYFK